MTREGGGRGGVVPQARQPSMACLASRDSLRRGWRKVRSNGGGAGGDGVSQSAFAARLDRELDELSDELLRRVYRPGPLRRFAVRKPGGGARPLAIPCIRDRVVQSATLLALQPVLEGRQSRASFGYRPARGVADALAAVRAAHARGLGWTLEADICQFFDRIPHCRLMAELAIWFDTEDLLWLVGRWLQGFSRNGRGVAQGAPISPLLANLFLHPLDRMLTAAGHMPVRYADDFVVLARSADAAGSARRVAEGVLAERGLVLNAEKTRIVPPGTAFRFLGATLAAPAAARQRAIRS